MGRQKIQTQYTGVRYYEHPTRKLRSGGADRYFTIRYKINGKVKEECLGWVSEGWNAQKANAMRAQLKVAQTTGDGPKTLEAMRTLNEAEIKAEKLRGKLKSVRASLWVSFLNIITSQGSKEKKEHGTLTKDVFINLSIPNLAKYRSRSFQAEMCSALWMSYWRQMRPPQQLSSISL